MLTHSAPSDWPDPRYHSHSNHAVHLAILYQGHQAIFDSPDRHHFRIGWDTSCSLLSTRQLLGHTYHSTIGLCGFAVVYQSNPRQDLVDVSLHADTADNQDANDYHAQTLPAGSSSRTSDIGLQAEYKSRQCYRSSPLWVSG
jgi:hypothetical protein